MTAAEPQWPMSDEELDAIQWFIEQADPDVVKRAVLDALAFRPMARRSPIVPLIAEGVTRTLRQSIAAHPSGRAK